MGTIVCCKCNAVLKEDVPGFDGDSHGYCPEHFEEAMAELEAEIARTRAFIDTARAQGATWYSGRLKAFWRQGPSGLEVAEVTDSGVGEWRPDWRIYPPESAGRI